MNKMSEAEILSAVESAEQAALGWGDGELSFERETMLNYYNQELYGNEVEGRSQIVTSEVADTVEWILPSLMKIFSSGDKAVEFDPQGPEDVEGAQQASDSCNYVFYHMNPGFQILYTMFKDALIQKNGYVKVYYEKTEKKKKETYNGITDDQMTYLVKDGIEIIQHTAYQTMDGEQPVTLHDVVLQITEPYGKVCIEPVPPEEILVSQELRSVDVQKAHFFAHRRQMTISDLNEMGFDTEGLSSDDNWLDTSMEAQARNQFTESKIHSGDEADESMRKVWVTEAYIRMDLDGDGIAELVKVIKTAGKVLDTEEVEIIPFAAITPIIMSHRHHGKSLAEVVADLQLLKSTITRQVLDNVYLTNSPRQAVLSNQDGSPQANLDDLLTVRPGGIVREYVPGAVRNLDIPFMGQAGLQVMEYLDGVKENRTGVTRYNQGIDANSLNKTATGVTAIMSASQQRIELIARVFAETGVTQIFKLIMQNLAMYHGRELTIRLDGEFVSYDPRNWNTEMDLIINVGIGNGNKDQQLGHLMAMSQAQALAIQMGGLDKIVTLKNVYNVQAKIAQNAGFKNHEEYWTDPEKTPPQEQQQQPDPEMIKQQGAMQIKQAEMQYSGQVEIAKQQHEQQLAAIKHQSDSSKQEMDKMIELAKIEHQQQLDAARLEYDRWKAELDANTKLVVAELSAKTTLTTESMKQTAANDVLEFSQDGTAKPKTAIKDMQDMVTALNSNMLQLMTNKPKETVRIQRVRDVSGKLVQAIKHYDDGSSAATDII